MPICAQAGPNGCFCEMKVGHLGPHDFEAPDPKSGGRAKRQREVVNQQPPQPTPRKSKPIAPKPAESLPPPVASDPVVPVANGNGKEAASSKRKAAATAKPATIKAATTKAATSKVTKAAAPAAPVVSSSSELAKAPPQSATAAPAPEVAARTDTAAAGSQIDDQAQPKSRRTLPMSSKKAQQVGEALESATAPASPSTTGLKVHYLLKRKPGSTQHELSANVLAYHLPKVSSAMLRMQEAGEAPTMNKCSASLYDTTAADAPAAIDGVVQMWFPPSGAASASAIPAAYEGPFTTPADACMQAYSAWRTEEHVLLDPSPTLRAAQKNAFADSPRFPVSRSGFLKVTVLMVPRKPDLEDQAALFKHLLSETGPRWRTAVEQAGGFGCVLNLSKTPGRDPYVAMLELYFNNAGSDGWPSFEKACASARGSWEAEWVDPSATIVLKTTTEFVGFDVA